MMDRSCKCSKFRKKSSNNPLDRSQDFRSRPASNYSNPPSFNRFNKQFGQPLAQKQSAPLLQQQSLEDTKQHCPNSSQPAPMLPFPEEVEQDYSASNLGEEPFDGSAAQVLNESINHEEVEIKPDGSIYLPEIKYRKILLRAFGPGGWALVPKGPHSLINNVLSREYALHCKGRFVSQARGHATLTNALQTPASSSESVRSNALMRCCKDLGIANDLWDARFVQEWKAKYAAKRQDPTGRQRMLWYRKEGALHQQEE